MFMPRPRFEKDDQNLPIKVGAMIRASSSYRSPEKTMGLFKEISKIYGKRIEVRLYGMDTKDPEFSKFPIDYETTSAEI